MMNLAGDQTRLDMLDASAPVSFEPGMQLREIEKHVILTTLKQQSFNRTRAARVLGIGIRTLQRKLKQYREETGIAMIADA
jgi:DNA-binding NtrC family response regulator